MYAIVEVGSHQYRVEPDSEVTLFRQDTDEGESIEIDNVLFYSDGDQTLVGQPYLDNVTIDASVKEHFRGDKITVFNYKNKHGRRRKIGHRDDLTRITINNINLN